MTKTYIDYSISFISNEIAPVCLTTHQTHCYIIKHLKSQRCDQLTTRKICKNKPILFDIHQTLNTIDILAHNLLFLPLQLRNRFRFPSSSGNSVVLSVPQGSCVSCSVRLIVASVHCWCCSARKTHPLLAPSLPLPSSDWLASRGSDITLFSSSSLPLFLHSLLFSLLPSFSDHSFIVFILISPLHSPGAKRNMSIISSVIGRICQRRRRNSVRQRSDDMLNAEKCSTAPLKASCWWFGGRE